MGRLWYRGNGQKVPDITVVRWYWGPAKSAKSFGFCLAVVRRYATKVTNFTDSPDSELW